MIRRAMVLLEVLRAGKRVNNPEAWKSGQVKANHLATLVSAVLVFVGMQFNMNIEIGEEQLLEISTAVIGLFGFAYSLFNTVSTVVSTNRVGMSGKRQPKAAEGAPHNPGYD